MVYAAASFESISIILSQHSRASSYFSRRPRATALAFIAVISLGFDNNALLQFSSISGYICNILYVDATANKYRLHFVSLLRYCGIAVVDSTIFIGIFLRDAISYIVCIIEAVIDSSEIENIESS